MGDGVTIDLGSVAPYIVESVLGWFGRDSESLDWKTKIGELVKLSWQQASTIQCVGMPEPISISKIYQRTSLYHAGATRRVDFQSIVDAGQNATIFAGPGWGKTTFLHWMYFQFCKNKKYVPLLFTLRWPTAVADLSNVVREFQHGRQLASRKGGRLILLVDGYDEITEEDRENVSRALMLFASLDIGNFYLTCRSHYHVYDLKTRHLEIGPFGRDDALRFVQAYSIAYGSIVDGHGLLEELERHGLGEFYQHPLMLTLVCILRSGPNQQIPRRAIGLLRRAIDTLTFRWDEAKKVHRESTIPLDGEERIRCLMRIAYDMNSPQEEWETVRNSVSEYLRLLQAKGVNIRGLLEEMARFYGIFVPIGEEYWQFVHRTIHDYLSARYWVESGKFNPKNVATWDMHAVYAACLTADATEAMVQMLIREKEINAFIECLYNSAPFQAEIVAQCIILRTCGAQIEDELGVTHPLAKIRRTGADFSVQTSQDLYAVCTDEFLRILLLHASTAAEWSGSKLYIGNVIDGARAVAVCAIGELYRRKAKIRSRHISMLQTLIGQPEPSTFSCLVGERDLSFTVNNLVSSSVP